MTTRVLIIDYGSGNLRSVAKAIEHVAEQKGGITVSVSNQAADVANASHIILPGVGAFADCRAGLDAVPGMREALARAVLEEKRWFLGICVGMQLLADVGHEHGTHAGLGWIGGEVRAIPRQASLKIPHMGWNSLALTQPAHPLLQGIAEGTDMYFVHSYYFVPSSPQTVLATTKYGVEIPAIIAHENIAGVQFHPEKSQKAGLQFLSDFIRRSS